MAITLIVSILAGLFAIIYTYFQWTYQYWKKRNVPYQESSFPFGAIESPFTRTDSIGIQISKIYRANKLKNDKHLGLHILLTSTYIPIDLELVKNILTKDFEHFVDRGFYVNEKKDPIGAHLFAIGGQKWHNLRSKLTPTFTSGKLKGMFETLTNCGLILEKVMQKKLDLKEAIDIKETLACFTTDIIGSCAFGLECNSFEENTEFRKYGSQVFHQTKLQQLVLVTAFNFPRLGRFLGIRQNPKPVTDFFRNVVFDTVNYREKNNVTRKDFLQLLIDIRNNKSEDSQVGDGTSLTMEELAAQSFVFLIAGFETSSTTMTFALFELASNQELQDKVREEINMVLKKHDGKITYDSINDMKYMGQVIDETLRKYPPLPFITRDCTKDYKVPGEDLVIEKGIKVIIPIMGIHYDEEYYPDPEVFDPDRFSEENKNSRHQYAHLPFGKGPRVCIGLRFGVMQSKVGLASLLRNFRFTVSKKTRVPLKMSTRSFILTTEGGIWLDFEKL